MKNKKYRSGYKTNSKKTTILVVVVALVLGGLVWWFLLRSDNDQPTTPADVSGSSEDVVINPPSEDDTDTNNAVKDELPSQNDSQTPASAGNPEINNVSVVITNWGQSDSGSKFEVGAYAQILEASGKCKLTMKKGSTTLTGSSAAVQNPTTMSCGALSVPYAKVSPGTWSTTVQYISSKSTGSTTKQIKVE
ncbi:MAG TPA: hypothetical protein PKB09_00260 [Candidatus Saccharibacteria bacterium]|nr:hypothetical protein [Candidatus Saccharibacteria bacterium]